jgi:bifunctional enzyme CysN/CysC
MASSNLTSHPGLVTREERAEVFGARGATLWLTGLSGSGKSTVAAAVEQRLVSGGRSAYRLDGDHVRTGLSADLGYSREDREENTRRTAEVACLFADAGLVAIVALISPYAEARLGARRLHERSGLPFVEIYLAASAGLCATRDPKGLYARATAGSIGSFTGIDDPYEVPDAPDLTIEAGTPLTEAVDAVVAALGRADQVPPPSAPSGT